MPVLPLLFAFTDPRVHEKLYQSKNFGDAVNKLLIEKTDPEWENIIFEPGQKSWSQALNPKPILMRAMDPLDRVEYLQNQLEKEAAKPITKAIFNTHSDEEGSGDSFDMITNQPTSHKEQIEFQVDNPSVISTIQGQYQEDSIVSFERSTATDFQFESGKIPQVMDAQQLNLGTYVSLENDTDDHSVGGWWTPFKSVGKQVGKQVVKEVAKNISRKSFQEGTKQVVREGVKEGVKEASKQGGKEALKNGIKTGVGVNIVWEGVKWVANKVTGSRLDEQASEVASIDSFSGTAVDGGFTLNPVTLSPFDGFESGRIIAAQASVDSSSQSTLHTANPTQQTHQDQFFQQHNDVLA